MPSHPTGVQGGRDVIAHLPPDPGTKKPRMGRGLYVDGSNCPRGRGLYLTHPEHVL